MRPTDTAWILLTLVALLALSGCTQDMKDQARYEPLESSPFFEDGRASRVPPVGTVARGHLRADAEYYTGIAEAGGFLEELPMELSPALLERGQSRYEIFCRPCHGSIGDGLGMIVRRGMKQPSSYHVPRLRAMPPGYFYDVITNGFGVMYPYAAQIKPHDRWAIVAYIRALQLSQYAEAGELSSQELQRVRQGAAEHGAQEEDAEHGSSGH